MRPGDFARAPAGGATDERADGDGFIFDCGKTSDRSNEPGLSLLGSLPLSDLGMILDPELELDLERKEEPCRDERAIVLSVAKKVEVVFDAALDKKSGQIPQIEKSRACK